MNIMKKKTQLKNTEMKQCGLLLNIKILTCKGALTIIKKEEK